jgi:hypothetical protein
MSRYYFFFFLPSYSLKQRSFGARLHDDKMTSIGPRNRGADLDTLWKFRPNLQISFCKGYRAKSKNTRIKSPAVYATSLPIPGT